MTGSGRLARLPSNPDSRRRVGSEPAQAAAHGQTDPQRQLRIFPLEKPEGEGPVRALQAPHVLQRSADGRGLGDRADPGERVERGYDVGESEREADPIPVAPVASIAVGVPSVEAGREQLSRGPRLG